MFSYCLDIIITGIGNVYSLMSGVHLMEYRGQDITLLDAVFSVLVLFAVVSVFFGDITIDIDVDD